MDISLLDRWQVESWEVPERTRAIVEFMRAINFKDKRVLDLGSHLGMFSYAAACLGANYICGVEKRPYEVSRSLEQFEQIDVDADYRFVNADYFVYPLPSVDIVLATALLYHHPHNLQIELLNLIRVAARQYVIIETMNVENHGMAVVDFPTDYGDTLHIPTNNLYIKMFTDAGFAIADSRVCIQGRQLYLLA